MVPLDSILLVAVSAYYESLSSKDRTALQLAETQLGSVD